MRIDAREKEGRFAAEGAVLMRKANSFFAAHCTRAMVAERDEELNDYFDATMRSLIAYCTSSALFLR